MGSIAQLHCWSFCLVLALQVTPSPCNRYTRLASKALTSLLTSNRVFQDLQCCRVLLQCGDVNLDLAQLRRCRHCMSVVRTHEFDLGCAFVCPLFLRIRVTLSDEFNAYPLTARIHRSHVQAIVMLEFLSSLSSFVKKTKLLPR